MRVFLVLGRFFVVVFYNGIIFHGGRIFNFVSGLRHEFHIFLGPVQHIYDSEYFRTAPLIQGICLHLCSETDHLSALLV